MKRSDLTASYLEKNKDRLSTFLREEKDASYSNPALFVHEDEEERPYILEDFVREEFHIVLVDER